MTSVKVMELTKEIVIAQISATNHYVNDEVVTKSLESVFNKIKELTKED